MARHTKIALRALVDEKVQANMESFIRAWNASATVMEVQVRRRVEGYEDSIASLRSRACRLRKAGVMLEKHTRQPRRVDIARLRRIARNGKRPRKPHTREELELRHAQATPIPPELA